MERVDGQPGEEQAKSRWILIFLNVLRCRINGAECVLTTPYKDIFVLSPLRWIYRSSVDSFAYIWLEIFSFSDSNGRSSSAGDSGTKALPEFGDLEISRKEIRWQRKIKPRPRIAIIRFHHRLLNVLCSTRNANYKRVQNRGRNQTNIARFD